MSSIQEPVRETPICHDCDLVVVGASCTGVFAALRAARLGLPVALVEVSNRFGGVATNGLVNVWHSTFDVPGRERIIGGLTLELCDRLAGRGALVDRGNDPNWQFCFNASELCCELDALVGAQPAIRPFLHARVVGGIADAGRVTAVLIEDKSGRRAIRCRAVIDASGDADLLRRLDPAAVRRAERLQPPTTAAILSNIVGDIGKDVFGGDSPIPPGFLWGSPIPDAPGLRSVFGTRVHGVDCSDADQLTRAEIEGRRQVRMIVDRLRQVRGHDQGIGLVALASTIGVRETCHADCHHRLTVDEVLHGAQFDDAIAHGTYRVDVHQQGGEGCIFRYLDGREELVRSGQPSLPGRWRAEQAEDPRYYSLPYRCLVPRALRNCWVAGRCIDSDEGAHGALRVMVNCNQMGEAAGVAAALALRAECDAIAVDPRALRHSLNAGGSLLR